MAKKQHVLFKSRGIKYLIALSIVAITTTSLTLNAEPEKAATADKSTETPKKTTHAANTNLTEKQRKPINDYNITINYELGMHCTGFDFTYCCILPVRKNLAKASHTTYPHLVDTPSLKFKG